MFKIKKDPRITKTVHLLENTALMNCLRFQCDFSDMSLVGPRPMFPREVAQYTSWQLRRIDTVPGMTGLWQVSGRNDIPLNAWSSLIFGILRIGHSGLT
jgi:lipopolysaccharide/colanic/teichoic acid biosynthesis glycosyltransferase